MSSWIAVVPAVVFAGLGALHAYWALGGLWPGKDPESLGDMVLGGPAGTRVPGPAACLAVFVVLGVGSVTVLASAGWLGQTVQPGARLLALAGASVLTLRGVQGFFDTRLRPGTRGSRFARLNVVLYSPLCLGLAALTIASAMRMP